jgi:hypothetical protein
VIRVIRLSRLSRAIRESRVSRAIHESRVSRAIHEIRVGRLGPPPEGGAANLHFASNPAIPRRVCRVLQDGRVFRDERPRTRGVCRVLHDLGARRREIANDAGEV